MILPDTSIWVDHFKSKNGNEILKSALANSVVYCHSMIYGELLLGGFLKDQKVNQSILYLPFTREVVPSEINQFILNHSLIGKGIGWVDCNILYDSYVNSLRLITLDRALQKVSDQILNKT
jgi:predicted nucleic acid-binding protein